MPTRKYDRLEVYLDGDKLCGVTAAQLRVQHGMPAIVDVQFPNHLGATRAAKIRIVEGDTTYEGDGFATPSADGFGPGGGPVIQWVGVLRLVEMVVEVVP